MDEKGEIKLPGAPIELSQTWLGFFQEAQRLAQLTRQRRAEAAAGIKERGGEQPIGDEYGSDSQDGKDDCL